MTDELILSPFAQAARDVVARVLGMAPDDFAVTAPPRPNLGDFAVGCFPAARALRQSPHALAQRVTDAFETGERLSGATASGPYVNFRANRASGFRHLFAGTIGGGSLVPQVGAGKTVCIDYSSPNISKHLAYHHIRSTVIGHALARLYRGLGYRVIGINHVGDWGTTHGMLLAAYHRWGADEPLTVSALNALYVRFRKEMKDDPTLLDDGRAWFKRLEDGDDDATALWRRFRDISLAEYDLVYRALGVEFEEVKGESEYLPDVPGVMAMLEHHGLLAESDGAMVVRSDDPTPMLVRKDDGATLYATRDLAAAIYRHRTYRFDRSLYVTGSSQSLHFRQVFDALARCGHAWAERCIHVPFGLVRIAGEKASTRAGNVVLLKDVLDDAVARARVVVEANASRGDAVVCDDELQAVAGSVGIGAVKFANLCSQREKGMDFEWEQVLSTSGDSGPYVQYAHARCASIIRRAATQGRVVPNELAEVHVAALTDELEWALALRLMQFGEVTQRAVTTNEPHHLCRYLLDVCAEFSRWYTSGNQDRGRRVLVDDVVTSEARLALVAVTKAVIARGLSFLGIDAPERM